MKTEDEKAREKLTEALRLVLDQVDFTYGNCKPTEMVGAVLPISVIAKARFVLDKYTP